MYSELKLRALYIYEEHLERRKNSARIAGTGWREGLYNILAGCMMQIHAYSYLPYILEHMEFGENRNCYIRLPDAAPILFLAEINRREGIRIVPMNPEGGLFCVGQLGNGEFGGEEFANMWLYPGWNTNRTFVDLDIAIGFAYKHPKDGMLESEDIC